MRRIILLSTVLFATPFGMGSYAADCATTSCQELGYTATSNKGDCLQCPFGKVNVIVLINTLAQELIKVHREQRVTVNIKNVIVQITMFGIAHKVNALLVHRNAQIIHLHLNKRYKYVVLQISHIPVGMNVNINKCTNVLAIQVPEEVLPVVVLPILSVVLRIMLKKRQVAAQNQAPNVMVLPVIVLKQMLPLHRQIVQEYIVTVNTFMEPHVH